MNLFKKNILQLAISQSVGYINLKIMEKYFDEHEAYCRWSKKIHKVWESGETFKELLQWVEGFPDSFWMRQGCGYAWGEGSITVRFGCEKVSCGLGIAGQTSWSPSKHKNGRLR